VVGGLVSVSPTAGTAWRNSTGWRKLDGIEVVTGASSEGGVVKKRWKAEPKLEAGWGR
jgi:hypothetical protein